MSLSRSSHTLVWPGTTCLDVEYPLLSSASLLVQNWMQPVSTIKYIPFKEKILNCPGTIFILKNIFCPMFLLFYLFVPSLNDSNRYCLPTMCPAFFSLLEISHPCSYMPFLFIHSGICFLSPYIWLALTNWMQQKWHPAICKPGHLWLLLLEVPEPLCKKVQPPCWSKRGNWGIKHVGQASWIFQPQSGSLSQHHMEQRPAVPTQACPHCIIKTKKWLLLF